MFLLFLIFIGSYHLCAMQPHKPNSPIQEEDFRDRGFAAPLITGESQKMAPQRFPSLQIFFDDLSSQESTNVTISTIHHMNDNSIKIQETISNADRAVLARASINLLFNKRAFVEKVILNENVFYPNKKNYICPMCIQQNDNFIEATNHMTTKHLNPNRFVITHLDESSDLLFDCDFSDCAQKVTEKNIDLHKFNCHTTKNNCDYCKMDFKNKNDLYKHICYFHNDLLYQCHICLLIIKNKYTFNAHLKDHNKKPSDNPRSEYLAHLVTLNRMSKRSKHNNSPE